MSKKIIAGVVGDVTAYAYAKAGGYTGTEEEFQALMAANVEAAKYADEVRAAAAAANEDKEAAAESKDAAAASASAAAASQADAATSKAAAETAANYARTYTGAPRVAATAAAMTDQSLIYVYTGSETGYTAGNWYFWDGTTWTSGGVYNSTALETDETLTVSGAAADAKVTGDEIGALNSAFDESNKNLRGSLFFKSDLEMLDVTGTGTMRAGVNFGTLTPGLYHIEYTLKSGKSNTMYLTIIKNGVYSQVSITTSPFEYNLEDTATVYVRAGGNGQTIDAFEAEEMYFVFLSATNRIKSGADYLLQEMSATKNEVADCNHETILGMQLFDKNAVLPNHYIDYETGALHSLSQYYVSDYIPVTPGDKYVITDNGGQQLALFGKTKNYKTGYSRSSAFNSQTIPNDCYYVRFTGTTSTIDDCWMSNLKDYVPVRDFLSAAERATFERGFVANKLVTAKHEIVKTVSTIQGLANVLASANAFIGNTHHLTIYLEEGTYNVTMAILTDNGFATYGLMIPDNVDIIGLGKGAKISCDLTGESSTNQGRISTLNTTRNNILKNLTIVANNCRYAVHNDFGRSGDYTQLFENCHLVHHGCADGNWDYPAAMGEGTKTGAHITYKNCIFESTWRAFYMHNNVDFDAPSINEFYNCSFSCKGTSMGHIAFGLESLGSGVTDFVIFHGCSFNGLFDCRVNAAAESGVVASDFRVLGDGNSNICENFYFTDGVARCIETENVELIFNETGSTIAHNTPVKFDGTKYVPLASDDSIYKCCGVVYGSIPANEYGFMRTGGYLLTTGISSTIGQKIGISNGALAVATGDEYLGVVKYYDSVYNRAYMELRLP